MHNALPSVYDFPAGYPDFESIKREALSILKTGSYIDIFCIGRPTVRIDGLRKRIGNNSWWSDAEYFFPITELFLAGQLDLDVVKAWVSTLFNHLAKESWCDACVQEADHIPNTFFLAWWIANKIFSEKELKRIRFDHGDEEWYYYGQEYVESYGCVDIDSIVQKIVEEITLPEKIEQKMQRDKDDRVKASALLQGKINERSLECFCH